MDFVKGEDGFGLFIKAIPYNYYSFLTLAMMIAMIVMKVEFGSMEKHELNALKGDASLNGRWQEDCHSRGD